MFESLTIITLSLIAFFAFQNMRLGLTSAVPKDPKNRAQLFASECLTTIKNKLAGAKLLRLEENKVAIACAQGSEELWSAEGHLWSKTDDKPPVRLNTLGEAGTVRFEQLSAEAIAVKIHAEVSPEAQHDVAVRLNASFN